VHFYLPRSSQSRTPLDEAAARGHESIVKLLLESGADIDPKSSDHSRTAPLYLAAQFGHLKVVEVLLKNKPNISWEYPKIKNTALEVAIKEGHE